MSKNDLESSRSNTEQENPHPHVTRSDNFEKVQHDLGIYQSYIIYSNKSLTRKEDSIILQERKSQYELVIDRIRGSEFMSKIEGAEYGDAKYFFESMNPCDGDGDQTFEFEESWKKYMKFNESLVEQGVDLKYLEKERLFISQKDESQMDYLSYRNWYTLMCNTLDQNEEGLEIWIKIENICRNKLKIREDWKEKDLVDEDEESESTEESAEDEDAQYEIFKERLAGFKSEFSKQDKLNLLLDFFTTRLCLDLFVVERVDQQQVLDQVKILKSYFANEKNTGVVQDADGTFRFLQTQTVRLSEEFDEFKQAADFFKKKFKNGDFNGGKIAIKIEELSSLSPTRLGGSTYEFRCKTANLAFDLLIQKFDEESKKYDGAIQQIIKNDRVEMMEYLVESGDDEKSETTSNSFEQNLRNTFKKQSISPDQVIRVPVVESARSIVSSVQETEPEEFSLLQYAAKMNQSKIVEYLIKKEANVELVWAEEEEEEEEEEDSSYERHFSNNCKREEESPLKLAVYYGSYESLKLLIEAQDQDNLQNKLNFLTLCDSKPEEKYVQMNTLGVQKNKCEQIKESITKNDVSDLKAYESCVKLLEKQGQTDVRLKIGDIVEVKKSYWEETSSGSDGHHVHNWYQAKILERVDNWDFPVRIEWIKQDSDSDSKFGGNGKGVSEKKLPKGSTSVSLDCIRCP